MLKNPENEHDDSLKKIPHVRFGKYIRRNLHGGFFKPSPFGLELGDELVGMVLAPYQL